MANMGLERYLHSLGLNLSRTPVGDQHIIAKMRQDGCNIGGEPWTYHFVRLCEYR